MDCSLPGSLSFIVSRSQRKQAKKQARQNAPDLKCLQMHLTTDTADFERMVAQAKSFLADGDRVKLSLRFRGRRTRICRNAK